MTSLSEQSKPRDICPTCGQERRLRTEALPGGIYFGYHCECERKARIAAYEEMRKLEVQEKIQKIFQDAHIPRRYQNCTIKNFQVRPEQKRAAEAVRGYIEKLNAHLQEGTGLVLCGKPGTGKTHLAVAVLIAALEAGHTGLFQNALELMYTINATYHDVGHTEKDIFETLRRVELLILDDVGKGKWTETVEGRMYTLINARYSEMLPTIVTTNLTIQGLRDFVGQAVFDRLRDCCVFVPVEGESYRLLKAKGEVK